MSLNGYLNTPPRKIPVGKVLCYVTGKLRQETQEEIVRQRLARSLVEEYGYKKIDLDINFMIKIVLYGKCKNCSKGYPVIVDYYKYRRILPDGFLRNDCEKCSSKESLYVSAVLPNTL